MPNHDLREAFESRIKPLMDQVYDIARETGVSYFAIASYERTERQTPDGALELKMPHYVVANCNQEMMPDVMIAIVGLIQHDLLRQAAFLAANAAAELQLRSLRGELKDGDRIDPDLREALRLGRTFQHYMNALASAGIIPVNSAMAFPMPATAPAPAPAPAEEEADALDDDIAAFLRGLLNKKGGAP